MPKIYQYNFMGNEVQLIKSGQKRPPKKGEYYLCRYGDIADKAEFDFENNVCEILIPMKERS
jgi:hypothetical protein